MFAAAEAARHTERSASGVSRDDGVDAIGFARTAKILDGRAGTIGTHDGHDELSSHAVGPEVFSYYFGMPLTSDASTLDHLSATDPEIADAIRHELKRQDEGLELIASENFVSMAVLEAAGSVLTNKYAEGYPGKRYYGGCEFVDVAESLAIERAKQLFGAEHVNVQAHSGAQANMSVYVAMLKPGDTILGMNLAHGGHLTHGHPLNFSGKYFKIVPYGVREGDERLDYDELDRLAKEHRPKIIVAGASAYPRQIDFARIRQTADETGVARHDGYGPHRRTGRGRRASQPSAALGFRDDNDAQDPARSPRRDGALQEPVREGPRPRVVPGGSGRAVDAHHRGQGGLLQGSTHAGVPRRTSIRSS